MELTMGILVCFVSRSAVGEKYVVYGMKGRL
jgi:hypothetical protein